MLGQDIINIGLADKAIGRYIAVKGKGRNDQIRNK